MPRGQKAPAFSMETWDGGTISLKMLEGKFVILDFWATWCGPCQEEMPTLLKLAREYEGTDVVFIAASRDDPSTWKADVGIFADTVGKDLLSHVALADERTDLQFKVEVLPSLFLIGPDGILRDASTGYASESELRRRIERARKAPP